MDCYNEDEDYEMGDHTAEVLKEVVRERGPTWKWVVGILGGLVITGVPVAVWAGSIKSDTAAVVDNQKSLLESQMRMVQALSSHSERIVKVETDQEAIHRQLASIERTIEKVDTKLDKVLDKK